jgi:hypothetical protein
MKGTPVLKTNSKHLVQNFSLLCTSAHGIQELKLKMEKSHETVANASYAGRITWILSKGSTGFVCTSHRGLIPCFNLSCSFRVFLLLFALPGLFEPNRR